MTPLATPSAAPPPVSATPKKIEVMREVGRVLTWPIKFIIGNTFNLIRGAVEGTGIIEAGKKTPGALRKVGAWVGSSIRGGVEGGLTATFGAAAGGLSEVGKGIAETGRGMAEAVTTAKKEIGERPHVAKLAPVITGTIKTVKEAVAGVLGLPFRLVAGMIGKPFEGAEKVISGVFMQGAGRSTNNADTTLPPQAAAH